MRRFTGIILLMLIVASSFTPFAFAQDYLLGPGDVLAISVYGFEDLQVKDLAIRPDGKIAFPLVGELTAAGLSSGQLSKQLTQGLAEYLKDPKVTINIQKYRTTRVYVLGEITKPGVYELDKQHDLLNAISMAGGYTKTTAKKNVFIVKKDKPDQPIKANLLDILEKGDMRQNYALAEGDVVYLTHNGRIDFVRDVMPFITGMYYLDRIEQ
jgi:polysaccharide export outer membrane protein